MRVAIVGSCGSGKTTVARELQLLGYDAYVVGQEHTEIRDLWRRRSPDALVFLDVSLDVIRQRRGENWPEWLYALQQQRLANAREHADVAVDTGLVDIQETVSHVAARLSAIGELPGST